MLISSHLNGSMVAMVKQVETYTAVVIGFIILLFFNLYMFLCASRCVFVIVCVYFV